MDNYPTHKNKRSTEASLIFIKGILVLEQGKHPREGGDMHKQLSHPEPLTYPEFCETFPNN
jgi:hypothetical protein